MRNIIAVIVIISVLLTGCGGSGGSNSGGDATDRALDRAMQFHDAALALVEANIIIACESITCPLVRGGGSVRTGSDREQSVCVHECVAVELPGEVFGEVEMRFFLVTHEYDRPLNGCYIEPQVALAVPYTVPCLNSPF